MIKFDHIGIAVTEHKKLTKLLNDMGIFIKDYGIAKAFNIHCRFFGLPNNAQNINIELINDNDKIEKFVKKQNKNAVLHHIAFVVDDLNKTIAELRTKGYKFIEPTISKGAKKDMYIAFLQLESTNGILIELIEYRRK